MNSKHRKEPKKREGNHSVFVCTRQISTKLPIVAHFFIRAVKYKDLEGFIMKKTIVILFSLCMVLSLASCGNSAGRTGQPETKEDPVGSQTGDDVPTGSDDEDTTENMDDPENLENGQEGTENSGAQQGKVLVAYFSATNTTEGIAEHIANGLNAELYEIVPEEPYTDADLNYNDDDSRTTIEMNDPDARPAISGAVENMEQYSIVFIGYPIWWGDAPRIVSTFMENYDFSGKTIIPFCTSGGNGLGSSAENLEQLTNGASWLSGTRFNGDDSQETVMEWIDSLDLNF